MIRLAVATDAPAVAAIYAPFVENTSTSFEAVAPTAEEMTRRIAAAGAYAPFLVYEGEGEVLGYAYASAHRERAAYRWSVDVSVYTHERARRQGVGRALYTSLFALLRVQGFYAAHAGITLPNPASVGLHESLGFVPVGVYRSVGFKRGGWHDVGWWQLALRERAGEPAPPLSMAEAVSRPEWTGAMAAGLSG